MHDDLRFTVIHATERDQCVIEVFSTGIDGEEERLPSGEDVRPAVGELAALVLRREKAMG